MKAYVGMKRGYIRLCNSYAGFRVYRVDHFGGLGFRV